MAKARKFATKEKANAAVAKARGAGKKATLKKIVRYTVTVSKKKSRKSKKSKK